MKRCKSCNQFVSEEIAVCPCCGDALKEGRRYIDDYRILDFVHEGYGSILYKTCKEGKEHPFLIRLFKGESGINEKIAERLQRELDEIKRLPEETFVRHYEIKKSSDGFWYRTSEWIEALNWGDLIASGDLHNYRLAIDLFVRISSALEALHGTGQFIPHLILADILATRDVTGNFSVKIDYKLSRFLDPKLDKPLPELKKLLEQHPDIQNCRPLDFRSDIWSLGKIFAELLMGTNGAHDYPGEIEKLPLPHALKMLFKQMLEADPDMRPDSISDITRILRGITDAEIAEAETSFAGSAMAKPSPEIKQLKKTLVIAALIFLLLLSSGVILQFRYGFLSKNDNKVLGNYAERHKKSVAFVLTEYWLEVNGKMALKKRSEGTAFLVDRDGYLLTNRHVACPWLVDSEFTGLLVNAKTNPKFGYRSFLWFEGEKAFFKHQEDIACEISDVYNLDTAYRSDGEPKVEIAGIIPPPARKIDLIQSPLGNDVAVLKINTTPHGIQPLPLSSSSADDAGGAPAPVMAIGFPLGSDKIPDEHAVASVTMGHIRRRFGNVLHISAPLHSGNSGGPVINTSGLVVGIATAVESSEIRTASLFSTARTSLPLSDYGLALPAARAISLLADIKRGCIIWNGTLNPDLYAKLQRALTLANEGDLKQAMAMADNELPSRSDPSLPLFAALLHFCDNDHGGTRSILERSASYLPDNSFAMFILFLTDWLDNRAAKSAYRQPLLTKNWQDSGEFYGYLSKTLLGEIPENNARDGWEDRKEKALLYYVLSLRKTKVREFHESENLLRQALLCVTEDSLERLLVFTELARIQKKRECVLRNDNVTSEYRKDCEQFWHEYHNILEKKRNADAEYAKIENTLEDYQRLITAYPDNRPLLVACAIKSAATGHWNCALEYTERYLSNEGRECANRLGMGLLRAQLLYIIERKQGLGEESKVIPMIDLSTPQNNKIRAVNEFKGYVLKTNDPRYKHVAGVLIGDHAETAPDEKWPQTPERSLTLAVALGFQAEADGNVPGAIKHYINAIESHLDNWLEYEFAKTRIKKLRQEPR